MGRAWQALEQKLAWNSRLRHPRGHGPRQPRQPHPRWGITVGGPEAPKMKFRRIAPKWLCALDIHQGSLYGHYGALEGVRRPHSEFGEHLIFGIPVPPTGDAHRGWGWRGWRGPWPLGCLKRLFHANFCPRACQARPISPS